MARSPAFALYASDFVGSPTVQAMTTEQVGAYILLLCAAWQDPDCTIPDDDADLAAITRLMGRWDTVGSRVRRCFQAHPDLKGRLHNPRLSQEREKQRQRAEAGRIGGLRRVGNEASKPQATSKQTPSKRQASAKQAPSKSQPSVSVSEGDGNGVSVSVSSSSVSVSGSGSGSESVSDSERETPPSPPRGGARAHEAPAGAVARPSGEGRSDPLIEAIIEAYHRLCPDLPRVQPRAAIVRRSIRARIREDADRCHLPWWEAYLGAVAASDWLCGRSPTRDGSTWRADLAWLATPTGMERVLAGRYQTRTGQTADDAVRERLKREGPPRRHEDVRGSVTVLDDAEEAHDA